MAGPGFAVIDFETTGLFAGGHDRVIEIAVVHLDASGEVEGRWETLVNPGRDLGPQRIHQIRASDVVDAPSFSQIAAQLVELLMGRVIVAHNASFDLKFLVAELERTTSWFSTDFVSLCTMQLARDYLPGAGRALADCCAALDIQLDDAHRASADAFATAQLLAAYLQAEDQHEPWQTHLDSARDHSWPVLDRGVHEWMPRPPYTEVTAASFLQRITQKMPEYAGPAECLDYLALLDLCLLDRHFSIHESRELVALAEGLGISRTTCELLHLEYFNQLTRTAWDDGILTDEETADLVHVGDLLDISTATITAALESAASVAVTALPEANSPASGSESSDGFTLKPGDLIVLTGEMSRPRSEIAAVLVGRGFTPRDAVTKKVRLLVAADPDSLSGKARKARDYGIPVVDEIGLERLLR
ncbi:exonuclease domain-containing protein [Salinibacterium sp. M195]|uniref:exonuclease domain-containing protein n=1 Tax=Salinibacterium sp. M195 TaxID=2583374 RepID=UPI001C629934|nr:exonuclease domain-containing protein [Salinibacterium sp. M195]QYH35545.1 DNA polymerase III subunit epsilon [Salinibacterium sp. M195]